MTTATVDDKQRVRLRDAKPGQVFSVEPEPGGAIRLVPVISPSDLPPAKVRFEKRGCFTVGVVDRPIDEEALKQALEEFP